VLSRVKVILVGSKKTYSVGSAARVLSSLECLDLVFVAPRTNVTSRRAYSYSKGAQYLIRNARVCASLEEALAACAFSVGFMRWSPGVALCSCHNNESGQLSQAHVLCTPEQTHC
jgi:tRNA (cytidine32/uridine32-2'-O)-methyltransferase